MEFSGGFFEAGIKKERVKGIQVGRVVDWWKIQQEWKRRQGELLSAKLGYGHTINHRQMQQREELWIFFLFFFLKTNIQQRRKNFGMI